ncbi:glutamate racemase [Marinicrinis lubricantis]|uniref:Glutamate racemase n=1 Tax=Marinicrinis lubricantis TaxID=2086470 RepID=A0ABW1IT37_9BACL
MQRPIAILDSGVGGLTVAKEIMRQLPQENMIYFGDSERSPYGPRSAEEVRGFTRQIVDFLLPFHPKMIVIACNTATAAALSDIRKSVDIEVVGVIEPGARTAITKTKNAKVAVIGTEGTIKSGAYRRALQAISPQIEVYSMACPQFVPIVEKGLFDTLETMSIVEDALQAMKQYPIDCMILGCTHYPFLQDTIAKVMGPDVELINSAEETAREVSTILSHKQLLRKSPVAPYHRFFCSGDPKMFQKIAQLWLNEEVQVTPVIWQVSNII